MTDKVLAAAEAMRLNTEARRNWEVERGRQVLILNGQIRNCTDPTAKQLLEAQVMQISYAQFVPPYNY